MHHDAGGVPSMRDGAGKRLTHHAASVPAAMLFLLIITAFSRNALYADPVALWRDTARKAPKSERSHYNLGTELKNIGLLDQARLEWERTLELNPRHSQALNQLGSIWFLAKEYEKAEQYYLAAYLADRNNIEACYNLAMTYEIRGSTAQALLYYEQFLLQAPPEYHDLALSVSRKAAIMREALRK